MNKQEKKEKIIELRSQGKKWAEIAEELGYGNVSTLYRWAQRNVPEVFDNGKTVIQQDENLVNGLKMFNELFSQVKNISPNLYDVLLQNLLELAQKYNVDLEKLQEVLS